MYTFDSRVRYSEMNERGKLSVSAIVNYFQDCSTLQSEDIGKGIAYLSKRRRAWWLSSWQIVVDRYPELGESITIGTWPYDFKGMYGYRNFIIKDNRDQYLVRANSIWFFYDLDARRPVKIQPDDIRGYGTGSQDKLDMNYASRKILMGDSGMLLEPIVIERYHIDTNHHVNNAQYVEIAAALLPDHFIIEELRVEYKRAAIQGDIMIPYLEKHQQGYTVLLSDLEKQPYAIVWMKGKEYND